MNQAGAYIHEGAELLRLIHFHHQTNYAIISEY